VEAVAIVFNEKLLKLLTRWLKYAEAIPDVTLILEELPSKYLTTSDSPHATNIQEVISQFLTHVAIHLAMPQCGAGGPLAKLLIHVKENGKKRAINLS